MGAAHRHLVRIWVRCTAARSSAVAARSQVIKVAGGS